MHRQQLQPRNNKYEIGIMGGRQRGKNIINLGHQLVILRSDPRGGLNGITLGTCRAVFA